MPLFRRNVEVKVVRPSEEKAEQPEPVLESKIEAETVDKAELEKLQTRWRNALADYAQAGYPNAISLMQHSIPRFFYVLKTLGETLQPGRSIREFLALRDDLVMFRVRQTFKFKVGSVQSESKFERVSRPQDVGWPATRVLQLVNQVLHGETPL